MCPDSSAAMAAVTARNELVVQKFQLPMCYAHAGGMLAPYKGRVNDPCWAKAACFARHMRDAVPNT